MLIIGFGHKARRGKDTAVQAIIDARGSKYDIRRYAFADELKREYTQRVETICALNQCTPQEAVQELCAWAKVEYDPNPDMTDPLCPYGKQRKLLQWWGTEYRRAQDHDYWVNKLFVTIEHDRPQVALITDMRFYNEMFKVKEKRFDRVGFCVRMDRTGFEEAAAVGHRSEQELDSAPVGDPRGYDFGITVNDGDVQALKDSVVTLFDMIVDFLRPPDANDFTLEALEAAENAEREAIDDVARTLQG
jgi:hypothetical protein